MNKTTEKSNPKKLKPTSITLSDEYLEVLQTISKIIGTETYSAAIRYLINRYKHDYLQKADLKEVKP